MEKCMYPCKNTIYIPKNIMWLFILIDSPTFLKPSLKFYYSKFEKMQTRKHVEGIFPNILPKLGTQFPKVDS